MKPYLRAITAALAILLATQAHGQIYGKLNAAYALAGVINPQVEITLSERMTFQTEVVWSPWKYIVWHGTNYPMRFITFGNEARWFLRAPARGWYAGLNFGFQGFNMTKPDLYSSAPLFGSHYGKGWGVQGGASIGYQWTFAQRWLLDAYAGLGYQISWYNSYLLDGSIELYPHGHDPTAPPDPWNASAEWGINKAGVAIGYRIFSPHPKHD